MSDSKKKLDRRKFLAVSGAVTGALSMGGSATEPFTRLTASQAETARAVCEVMLAPRAGHPGVGETGLVRYLDREYRGVREFLVKLEEMVRGVLGSTTRFDELQRDQQVEIMGRMEKEAPALFHDMRHCIVEGYYSHPDVHKAIGYGGPAQFTGYPEYNKWPVEPEEEEGR